DHLPRRRLDGSLPIVRREATSEFLAAVREDDAARVVDDRAQAVDIERWSDVAGRTALGAKAGHEEPGVRHRRAQLGELLGIRRADHGPDGAIWHRSRHAFERQALDEIADVPIKPPAVYDQILKLPAAGVRGFHQHKDARSAPLADIDKRP